MKAAVIPEETVKLECKEALESLLSTIRWYQDSLYSRASDYQSIRVLYVKMILGLYAVLIPAIVTIIAVSGKFSAKNTSTSQIIYNIFDDQISIIIICSILITVGLVSLSLLRIIVTSKASAVLAERQMNCNRQAIHAIYLEYFDGIKTEKEEDFYTNEEEISKGNYCKIFGRHRRYPIGNDHLRKQYKSFFTTVASTEDGLLAAILSILTTLIFSLGTFGLLYSTIGFGYWAGISTAIVFLMIIAIIVYINHTSLKPVQEALKKQIDKCNTIAAR